MWNLKKDTMDLAEHKLTHRLKNVWFPKETGWGLGDALRVWDGNAVKSGCDNCGTPINVVKFIK